MGITKRPGLLTFLIALAISLAAVLSYAGLKVPVIGGREFFTLLAGHGVLVLGCLMRGL